MKNKKAAGGVGMVVLIVVIILVVFWAILKYASRQCSNDTHCPADYYCGSDFKCHQFKVVEKTVVVKDYTTAAIIIAIALIIAILLLRDNRWNYFTNRFFGAYKGHVHKAGHGEHDHDCGYYNCSDHPMHPQHKDMYFKKK